MKVEIKSQEESGEISEGDHGTNPLHRMVSRRYKTQY